jgi:dolichyl-phosphate beta-glucosyltransferase
VTAPELSVVIPAFNEAARLPKSLAHILEYLRGFGRTFEIVVVDDGSRDGTTDVVRAMSGDNVVVVVNEQNRGKGYSVKRGMLLAKGQLRLMTDADLSTPIEELPRLLERLEQGVDVVIASRALDGSRIEVRQPPYREAMGRLFNVLVRLLVLPGLYDTQCGFKLFRGEAAAEAFALSQLNGFCFDVEVLYLVRRHGKKIAEIPVVWRNDAATRVSSLRGFLAFVDLARIRLGGWTGRYSAGSS